MHDKKDLEAAHEQTTQETSTQCYEPKCSDSILGSNEPTEHISPTVQLIESFPDGGLTAWSVVIGASLVSFATLGWVNSFGVFQSYYEKNILEHESASNIAWIGSIQYGFVRFPAFFTGWLLDQGQHNVPFAASSLLYVLSLFLIAECKVYWQFILCQGVANGIFAGMLYGTAPVVVSHWFDKRRSFALGIFAAGSSIGGTLFPITMQQLLERLGFQWTMRIMATILGLAILISNLLIRTRLPPSSVKHALLSFVAFKTPAFTLCVLAYNVAFLGLLVPLSYLNVSAQAASVGPPQNFTFYLISIANCASLIGRLASGYLADQFGPFNVLIPFTFIAGVVSYAWPYAVTNMLCIVITSIIYGCATGAFVSLLPSAPMRLGGMEDVGSRVGMATSFILFGSVGGPPIAGLIQDKSGGFIDVGIYAGSVIFLGCALLVITRRLALGRWLGRF